MCVPHIFQFDFLKSHRSDCGFERNLFDTLNYFDEFDLEINTECGISGEQVKFGDDSLFAFSFHSSIYTYIFFAVLCAMHMREEERVCLIGWEYSCAGLR